MQKIVVLASEPVGGRSWLTELPCFCYFIFRLFHEFVFDYYDYGLNINKLHKIETWQPINNPFIPPSL